MPRFSQASRDKLATAHPDLQRVLNLAIERIDFTVLYGYRSPSEQMELFKKGRVRENGQWRKVGPTVTNLDGKSKLSKHNYSPSRAVDIAPYPIDWRDLDRFEELAEVVKQCAEELGVSITWGGDWPKFRDYPHFELPL